MDDYIKQFCGIPEKVTVYDKQISANKKMAVARLEAANVSTDEKNDLVKDYVATFCRIRMVTEPSSVFIQSENARLASLYCFLTEGKRHDIHTSKH